MKRSSNSAHDTLAGFTFNPKLSSLACDHFHHFYHYQSSAQYLWLAETLRAPGRTEEMISAYDKAIFQDHMNDEAIEAKNNSARDRVVPVYDIHPASDAEFCKSVGRAAGEATKRHDEATAFFTAQNYAAALIAIDNAIAADAAHSNSYFLRGRIYFMQGEYEKARADLEESIRLAHLDHEAYHRFASEEHLARAKKFLGEEEYDLAITDCTKALDLDHKNKEALQTRAEIYRAKGSLQLAEWDETDAARL